VAVKFYDKTKLQSKIKNENVQNEIQILSALDCRYIVNFIKKFETNEEIQVIMEYGGKTNLRDFVEQERITPVSEVENPEEETEEIPICIGLQLNIAIGLYKQIVKSLVYLHSLEIVHRDIKLENIVIDDERKLIVKLVDFGFARYDLNQPIRTDVCGTPNYMAPELHARVPHFSKPADVWASGVIFFFLMTGYFPFGGLDEQELARSICDDNPLYEILDPKISTVILHLLKGVFEKNPVTRWDIKQVDHYLQTFT
jgi:serine/threonine protein kinase